MEFEKMVGYMLGEDTWTIIREVQIGTETYELECCITKMDEEYE